MLVTLLECGDIGFSGYSIYDFGFALQRRRLLESSDCNLLCSVSFDQFQMPFVSHLDVAQWVVRRLASWIGACNKTQKR